MSYFWPTGYPISVRTDERGYPTFLSWDWSTETFEVSLNEDDWLVDDWLTDQKRRHYYRVYTESHALTIFKNELTNEWYLQWLDD